ncbi:reverse transcriptase [Corchorus capsularis]|uniref:Reverse transcriptase n=1 Tax=Corchorus capsularis TaxID=210143 RepID=A0A1R3G1X7_COCAP|nr:reverse transcriptase [Corchorus capsularis]
MARNLPQQSEFPSVPSYSATHVRSDGGIHNNIQACSRALSEWDKAIFGNVRYKLEWKRKELAEAYVDSSNPIRLEECKKELDDLLRQEEVMWRQDKVLASFPCRVNDQMRASLDATFSADNVKEAVFQMQGDKAPGPDGFSPTFYQKCWSIVCKDVTEFVLNFLNTGEILSNINHTNIVLIPKVENPRTMKDFRPIALCNVIFKIISKVLANRLKLVLPQIIGESQIAFVPERMIYDNALIAFETIHFMRNKRSGKRAHLALKLDLSKAYDKVEWNFLEKCMYRLGFSSRWVNLVMAGVRSVSYSILINGQQSDTFCPTRGIRQGDPLSPYLFLFCMEVLSCLITHAEDRNLLHGIAINRAAPRISHLFFADDSILFLRASLQECEAVLSILHDFEQATGEQVNIDKSALLFISNISLALKDRIMRRLGVSRVLERDKYLGLPIMVGKNKKRELNFIKERLLHRVNSWCSKLFSIAGKAVMIQSIAQSVHIYLMSVFRFPKSFIHDLNMILAKFWWGGTNENRKIHWKAWDDICVSKLDGGLGFRDFEAFNLALLSKQCWRLIHNPDSLCSRILRAKYFPQGDFFKASLGHNPSFIWRSLLEGRKVIRAGSRWRIGSGNIDFWSGNWLSKGPCSNPRPRDGVVPSELRVADMMNFEEQCWRVEELMDLVEDDDISRILCLPIPRSPGRDTLIWDGNSTGNFTVKSTYFVARQQLGYDININVESRKLWRRVWYSSIPPKIRYFTWRLIGNLLPLKANLQQRGMDVDGLCVVCGLSEESVGHIFFNCCFSRRIWETVAPWLLPYIEQLQTTNEFWIDLIGKAFDLGQLEILLIFFWSLWRNRNDCLHSSFSASPTSMIYKAGALLQQLE